MMIWIAMLLGFIVGAAIIPFQAAALGVRLRLRQDWPPLVASGTAVALFMMAVNLWG